MAPYELQSLHIRDDDKLMVVIPNLGGLDNEGISVTLPEDGMQFNSRKVMHYPCDNARIRIEQKGVAMAGELLDFHAGAFCMLADERYAGSQATLVPDGVWGTTLFTKQDIVFSGECKVVRKGDHGEASVVVLAPIQSNIPVQKPKKHRCSRVKPVPAPHIRFRHQLTGKMVILDVIEISGSGFSVSEEARNALLLPGLSIPSLELKLSNLYSIKCSARVIHRTLSSDQTADDDLYICGIVITAMDMGDHTKLVAYIQQAHDQHTLICNSPDMDEMWRFFFETGFLYPKKFHHIHSQQSIIKKTLEKIYLDHPSTSRHFIIQDRGVIKGLIALQRVYKYTWMMHHLAARKDAVVAGPKVLRLIGSFINDSYHLEANRMKYAILYYRPENKFPKLVFGGVAKSVQNPQICSLDTFAYFQVAPSAGNQLKIDQPWRLAKTTHEDLKALETFYMRISGGLMLRAFDLLPDSVDDIELATAYQQANLKRERFLYTLRKAHTPMAIIMVQITDIGINLSDLTNCMHVFLLNPEGTHKALLESVLSHLARRYDQAKTIVNLFPESFAADMALEYEKPYTLWTYEMQYSDYYYDHLKKLSRFFKQ
jgi:hypothetical protein